jgi:hypothetical protein
MSVEASITLLTSLVGVGVAILLAGLPWAYGIHGRLATIEASLRDYLRHADQLAEMQARVTRLELRATSPLTTTGD